MEWRDNTPRLNNLRRGSYFCPPLSAPFQGRPGLEDLGISLLEGMRADMVGRIN